MTAAEIVSTILQELASNARAGVTLNEIDRAALFLIKKYGAESVNKGYISPVSKIAFPNTICLSVNDTVCHGIPSEYVLQDGDICGLDIGIKKDGQCGDAAIEVPIGEISNRKQRLLETTKGALEAGIKQVRAGVSTYKITEAIDKYCRKYNFVPSVMYGGHGIGKEMHMPPHVNNSLWHLNRSQCGVLQEGQIICVEPIVSFKDQLGVLQDDGWTVKTSDGEPSACYEAMVLVLKNGYKILTDHI